MRRGLMSDDGGREASHDAKICKDKESIWCLTLLIPSAVGLRLFRAAKSPPWCGAVGFRYRNNRRRVYAHLCLPAPAME